MSNIQMSVGWTLFMEMWLPHYCSFVEIKRKLDCLYISLKAELEPMLLWSSTSYSKLKRLEPFYQLEKDNQWNEVDVLNIEVYDSNK